MQNQHLVAIGWRFNFSALGVNGLVIFSSDHRFNIENADRGGRYAGRLTSDTCLELLTNPSSTTRETVPKSCLELSFDMAKFYTVVNYYV
ncbi:MAG: hypothetical protein K2Z81_03675 [Cyanobacteria bacterium]|nr:hypothetical protein [Cyanobacteriota bacterium]